MSDSEFVDLRTTIEDSNSNDSENDEITTVDLSKRGKFKSLEKSSKKRKIGEELEDDDDKELNKFLFGDKNKFLKNLEEKKTFFLDFRGDCNETSESSSSKWHDSDDDNYIRSKGLEAKDKQKRKHERIVGSKPIWANLGRKNVDVDEELITHSVGFLNESSSRSTSFLPRDIINFKRLGNLNRTTQKEGRIVSCEFHSKSTVGVTAGSKGLVSLFAIDGNENKKIHNVYYEKFIIHSCKLINNGTELLIGGQLRDFHTYNLMTGHKQRNKLPKGINHLKKFQISPCEKYIAVVGDFGEIHLLHSITKELLCSFKQEHQSTSLNFSTDSNEIFSHSDDNEVTIFDIRSQRVKHRFVDDGCVNGTSLALSPNGKFLATGGNSSDRNNKCILISIVFILLR